MLTTAMNRRSSNKLCVRWAAVSSIAVVFFFFFFSTSSSGNGNKEPTIQQQQQQQQQRHDATNSHHSSRRSERSSQPKANDYNLMEESSPHIPSLKEQCTIESMNALRLQQDHPCVIEMIRKHFLIAPSPPHVPYKLTHMGRNEWPDPTDGITALTLRRLDYKSGGFFVEAGAHNGEHLSNTLYMERVLDWTGILIEPSPENFRNLTTKNRKSFALNVCLSPKPYPIRVEFNAFLGAGGINRELGSRADDEDAAEAAQFKQIRSEDGHWNLVQSQCFPLYSILLAVNQTTVDYLSLDVEGHEIKILETIPWHKIRLNSMSVEWLRIPGGVRALRRFMQSQPNDLVHYDSFLQDLLYAKANNNQK